MKDKYKVLRDNIKNVVAQEFEKTLPIIAEEYEAKIRRQAEEITRLLAENKELKEDKAVLNAKIDAYELYGDQHEEEYNQAFSQGTEEAWELARKITCQPINGGFKRSEFEEIFGYDYIPDIFEKYSYVEATAKVAKWKKAKEEIKVDGNCEICQFFHKENDEYPCSHCCHCYTSKFKQIGGEKE